MATSITAYGNIVSAQERGGEIPSEWAVDEDGNPINDPAEFYALRPMADHKGYALALMVDVLSGILLGLSFGQDVVPLYGESSKPQKIGHFLAIIDIGSFTSQETFLEMIATMIGEIKDIQPATNSDLNELLVPGEPEARTKRKRLEKGIPLPKNVARELTELLDEYDVERDPP